MDHKLVIFSDEDGSLFAAFLWGEHPPAQVAALITPEILADASGLDVEDWADFTPDVRTYYLREADEDEVSDDFDGTYFFAGKDHPKVKTITGHRFLGGLE